MRKTTSANTRHQPKQKRLDSGGVGIALAGGGPLGAMYEMGALAALADCTKGLPLNDLDVYVGVSAGSLIAAGLANEITPHQMVRMFIEGASPAYPFSPEQLLRPAYRELIDRLKQLPLAAFEAAATYFQHQGSLWQALQHLGTVIPTGWLSGDEIHHFLEQVFSKPGRTNDFRKLKHRLYVIATDLDSSTSIQFGAPGMAHVPISRAAEASTALPGLFPPVLIDGRYYVDGALRKTLHASVALEHGARLLICINPLVPFDASPQARVGARAYRIHSLVDGGLPVVLSQTFRSLIQSRMDTGMERYQSVYPDSDVVLLQPDRTDADMFFTNIFSYSGRRQVCEHAYQRTRAMLLSQQHALAPKLARHGVRLDLEALRDPHAKLIHNVQESSEALMSVPAAQTMAQLGHTLDDLSRWLHTHS